MTPKEALDVLWHHKHTWPTEAHDARAVLLALIDAREVDAPHLLYSARARLASLLGVSEKLGTHTMLDELEARLSSQPKAVAEWRDISTAPKDGTEVVLCHGPPGYECLWFERASFSGGRWYLRDKVRWLEYPTHWAPLPALPSDTKGDER